jgi:hypothetical protein
MRELIERVAAGLRRMDNKPDFLLYLKDDVDLERICDIQLLFGDGLLVHLSGDADNADCYFLPIWKDNKNHFMDTFHFFKGYEEYCSTH